RRLRALRGKERRISAEGARARTRRWDIAMSLKDRRGLAGALLLATLAFGYGYRSRARGLFPDRLLSPYLGPGRPQVTDPTPGAPARGRQADDDQEEREERIKALGYAAGYSPPFERSGAFTYDVAKVSPGF